MPLPSRMNVRLVAGIAAIVVAGSAATLVAKDVTGGASGDTPPKGQTTSGISTLDRPAGRGDAMPDASAVAPLDLTPGTVRHAQDTSHGAVWLATQAPSGHVCLIVTRATGSGSTCNAPSMLTTWGAIPLVQLDETATRALLYGVVADGYATAQVGRDGARVNVVGNAFVLSVPRAAKRAIVTIRGEAGAKRLNYTAFLPRK